jgi:fido (protein-threonine AMPylation protein)
MGLTIEYESGQTPLSEEEMEGLKVPTITTREELDEFEQQNIEKALEWYLYRRKFKVDKILTEDFIQQVHVKMFGDVWSWAGQFRTSEKTIGIPWHKVPTRLRQLSRLMADIVMKHIFNKPTFTWGHKNIVDKSKTRSTYIKSLKDGDNGDFEDLIAFAQS